ncbi:MAG: hypothetical protein HC866_22830 [Leptolyngbyaceae cyanobacterium RU_5_1]|nr:hypothetical protein [Leptolyngbyaceae cyanobacterium RU_5_1]
MPDTDPVLQANSISGLMDAVNTQYGLNLPTNFPEGTPLADLWKTTVSVRAGNGEGKTYTAEGDTTYAAITLKAEVKLVITLT